MTILLGARQQQHVRALQRLQPRPILVQRLTSDPEAQKGTRWVPLDQVYPGAELWTRSVLLNEVLFDCDARPWSRVANATADLLTVLHELQATPYSGPSGGKGSHTSVFLDPASIRGPERLFERAQFLGVDIWSEARMTFAHAVFNGMGLPPEDDARWAPPAGGSGVWDRSKVKWSAARSGSMIRVLGTPGSAGARKTTVDWSPEEWRASAATEAPPVAPLKWFDAPVLYPIPPSISQLIVAAVERAVLAAEAVYTETKPTRNPIAALAEVKRVPCVARILREPASPGTRHYAFLNLAVTAWHAGVTRRGAESLMRQALALCGLDEADKSWQALQDVYAGRYSIRATACPSPHVSALCEPSCCPLSRGFTLR